MGTNYIKSRGKAGEREILQLQSFEWEELGGVQKLNIG